jgi:hypothetical protein
MKLVVLGLLAVALAGCGGGDDDARRDTGTPPAAGAPIPSGGLSVQEALDSDLEEPLMVRGYVIEREGELRLCDAILESYPPQCGEPSLKIERNGVAVSPSEERVSLLGEVEDGTIRLTPTAR